MIICDACKKCEKWSYILDQCGVSVCVVYKISSKELRSRQDALLHENGKRKEKQNQYQAGDNRTSRKGSRKKGEVREKFLELYRAGKVEGRSTKEVAIEIGASTIYIITLKKKMEKEKKNEKEKLG